VAEDIALPEAIAVDPHGHAGATCGALDYAHAGHWSPSQ
jgi:hypothetical protein